jgi:hypothetical protein
MGIAAKCQLCDGTEQTCRCDEWREYWANLTPADRERELRWMADYAAEADY